MTGTDGRSVVVLQSFPTPRPTTNPYVVQLARSLEALPDASVLTFTWRRALTGSYDVFHAHWPEVLVSGQSPLKKLVRQALFVLFLLRLRLTRTPLVRTRHNLELPAGISRRERVLLRWAERWTTLEVLIYESTPTDGRLPVATVLHGHYRDWFAAAPRRDRVPGRLLFFGQVRGYKNVDRLVTAFGATAGQAPELTLHVAGRPTSEEVAAAIRAAATGDERVTLALDFIEDDDVVAEVSAAELVVLPYREMHNSGSTLAALSLDRPVLVPDNRVNQELSAEVGAGWVLTYQDELTAADLLGALATVQAGPPAGAPDLHRREWAAAGVAHLEAYRRAIAIARG